MYVCMYVCMYMYACMYVYMYACMYIYVYECIYVCGLYYKLTAIIINSPYTRTYGTALYLYLLYSTFCIPMV